MKWMMAVAVVVIAVSSGCHFSLPGLAPELVVHKKEGLPGDNTLSITFLGNSTLVLDDGETGIVIDGFVSRPGVTQLLEPIAPNTRAINEIFSEQAFPRIDVVVPLHAHFDHFLDAPYLVRMRRAQLIGSKTSVMINRQVQRCYGETKFDLGSQVAVLGEPIAVGAFGIDFETGSHSKTRGLVQSVAPRNTFYRYSINPDVVDFCKPVHARYYRQGKSYNVYLTHHSTGGDIEIAVLGGMVQRKHRVDASESHRLKDADIIVLPLPVLGRGSDHQDFAKWLWKLLGEKSAITHIIPVHWDAFFSLLDKERCGDDRVNCLRMLPQFLSVAEKLDARASEKIAVHWMSAFDTLRIRREPG